MSSALRTTPLLLVLASVLAVACGSESSTPNAGNGVNDVRKACDIRVAWQHGTSNACTDCRSLATVAPCDCLRDKPYASACHEQSKARTNETTCGQVDDCVRACNTDCACVDACYAGKDACRKAASALEGCLAEVCDSRCR